MLSIIGRTTSAWSRTRWSSVSTRPGILAEHRTVRRDVVGARTAAWRWYWPGCRGLRKEGVEFSLVLTTDAAVVQAIAEIGEDAWVACHSGATDRG